MADDFAKEVIPVNLEDEMKRSYLDYAMSVIIGRALPDVRDGLKPVHRRVLYAMKELGNDWNKSYKKSARVVGDVIGKYHPHGDTAVYDAIVRMAQPFSMRYMLVDGQGNFGCFTGDTRIKLLDGTERSFEELSRLDSNEVFYVYSVDRQGRIVVGEGRDARMTRASAQLIELTLDNGESVRCTPDHRFMLRDGTYKEAEDLTPDDSLMPGCFDTAPVKDGLNDYLRVFQPATGEYEFVHRLADELNARKGLARRIDGPFVRHHKNFDRWDNRPTSLERMEFLEHLHLHAACIRELWGDDEFRERQREGVQRYYEEHPEAGEARRRRFVQQNKSEAFRRENGPRVAAGLKRRFHEDPEASAELSRRMKALWKDPDYRAKMSVALANLEKRPLTPEEKARVAAVISEKSRAMWADEEKRAEIVEAISRAMASDEIRRKLSAAARRNWQDPRYRALYPEGHFSRLAHSLWEDPEARKLHRQKIARQWQDPAFRDAQREGVQRSNARRLGQNPEMMSELTARATKVPVERWSDAGHKHRVMRRKIAGYAWRLLKKFPHEEITPAVYQANRDSNWIPGIDKALHYFRDFDALLEAGRNYNHRVVAIRRLTETADTYDITVDEHHNFLLACGVFVHNSVDGDAPAAMRYTEVRMARIAHELMADIDKETVDFVPNYDESEQEPVVLPTRVPHLLVNGSAGIAVGMATNVPPHNLSEVVDACLALIDDPEISIDALMHYLPGPDFPTAGLINGALGIHEAYHTGRGRIYVRARSHVETDELRDRRAIIVTELPYQVNKARLLEKIAELHKERRIEGISEMRDESDKDGMRVVIELRRGEVPEIVLNNLYQHTALQSVFGINMVALLDGQPRLLNLKEILDAFLRHRREVVTRRAFFDLRKARERAHVLEGLAVALANIDPIIVLIKAAAGPAEARSGLLGQPWTPGPVRAMLARAGAVSSRPEDLEARYGLSEDGYRLSPAQTQAILDLRLHRLTGLEQDRIRAEYQELLATIEGLLDVLTNPDRLMQVIREELTAVREQYGDARRTEIMPDHQDLTLEDLITEEDVVVTLSHTGYVKAQPLSAYRAQKRGGRGRAAASIKEEDFIDRLFVANTHDTILCFSNHGKVYWKKVYELPQAGRAARGKPIVNLLQMEEDERINAILPVQDFAQDRFLFFATTSGTVKKTALSEYARPRPSGLIAIDLRAGDQLVNVALTDGGCDIMLLSDAGKAIRFPETEVRPMGRSACGVRGMRLGKDQQLIALIALGGGAVLTVTGNGYGKRTPIGDYPVHGRGGQGVISIQTTERNGRVVGAVQVDAQDEIMLITDGGTLVRTRVEEISVLGRNTQGVKLISVHGEEKLIGVERIEGMNGDEDDVPAQGE